jgi:serine/threonine protein kinase
MHLPDEATIYARLPHVKGLTPMTPGGQKMVYRATHDVHGSVVLKLFLNAAGDERITREIEAITTASFTNVPRIFEWGTMTHAGGNTAYLVEQYVDGETLRDILNRQGTMPLDRALALLDRLLSSAVELEHRRLVHRDIKPENILVDRGGSFWLLDFGIARHLDKPSITVSAAPLGPATPGYAPPEQFGNIKRDIDIRADLFAIGVVTYETLTGTHPFRQGAHDRMDVYRRTATVDAAPLTIPGDSQKLLAGFVSTLMAKHPSRRPRTAKQAQDWFVALLPTIQGSGYSGGP